MIEFELIRNWAENKGILDKATSKDQMMKLVEEVGELSKAIQEQDKAEIEDAIGDCMVVLIILASMNGLYAENCLDTVYSVISKRKGKMVDGMFVKEKDK
jgi:NTP pyrophosphatase (non-canonical NTP hydrolase)